MLLRMFVLALIVGLVGCATKKVGDACETYRSEECGGNGGTCLGNNSGNYCTVKCASATDCPGGWKCANVGSYTVDGKSAAKKGSDVKMCVKP